MSHLCISRHKLAVLCGILSTVTTYEHITQSSVKQSYLQAMCNRKALQHLLKKCWKSQVLSHLSVDYMFGCLPAALHDQQYADIDTTQFTGIHCESIRCRAHQTAISSLYLSDECQPVTGYIRQTYSPVMSYE